MANPSDPRASFVQKLDQFAGTLNPEEQEVLGEIMLHATDEDAGEGEVKGFSSYSSTLLSRYISSARTAGKFNTRLQLRRAPTGLVLVADGAVSRLR